MTTAYAEPIQRTWSHPERLDFTGRHVVLTPIDPNSDVKELYEASHGDPERLSVWNYLFNGPFESMEAMGVWLKTLERSTEPIALTVFSSEHCARVGMISIMNIVPEHGRAELGSIWYTPSAQKTRVNTETIYLLLKHLFDDLRYRRVEWKCNNENAESKRAAERLGFQVEGLFRQHIVIKNRSRDTAWFSMIDKDWPAIRSNFEAYLNAQDLSLTELNRRISGNDGPA